MTSVAFHADQLFYRIPGGIGTYVRELLPELAAADPSLDVTVFHARFPGSVPPEVTPFRRVELDRSIRTLYPSWNLLGTPALPPPVAEQDVVHAPSVASVPPAAPGQRLVVTVHDMAFRVFPSLFPPAWRALFRTGLRRAARRADAVIAVSRSTATDLVRLARIDPTRLHVVPLASSLPAWEMDPEPVLERMKIPRPYLLFVGTLEPRKNLVRLIRAYRRAAVRIPHALVLTGPLGWRSKRLHRELALPGPGRIVVTGAVPPEALDALYRGAGAFAYPSLYEGFGLPVLEAMSRGVPTLIADAASLPEVAGEAALRVDPRSVRSIGEGIERLVGDRDLAERLGATGRDRAALYSWEQTARMTLKVYQQLT
ncbi:MAG TPA: glycosyltransferase family 1 protein [Actinomycetota bacterium]|nr:glycosyltransferase family 1 protein [Actinomycetota bacterium]